MDQRIGRTADIEAGACAGKGHPAAADAVVAAIGERQTGAGTARRDRSIDVDAAGCIQRQRCIGAPCDGCGNGDIAVLATARTGGNGHARRRERIGKRRCVDHRVVGSGGVARTGSGAVGNRDVVGVDQPGAGGAALGQCRHKNIVGDGDACPGCFNQAASSAHAAIGQELAGVAALSVRDGDDGTAAGAGALARGIHRAGEVDAAAGYADVSTIELSGPFRRKRHRFARDNARGALHRAGPTRGQEYPAAGRGHARGLDD